MKPSQFALVVIVAAILYILPLFPQLPIPADTIQGLYHPFRDISTEFSNGIPVNNPLITDPIRQQFPWKNLAIRQIKSGEIPLWNPYSFSGTPLLANIQSAVLYPLNLVFFIPYPGTELLQFARQWSLFIYLQTVLLSYFFYLYVRKIGVSSLPALIGSVAWALSGFNLAWWQWGNVGHTILWFPLILWSIEKLIEHRGSSWYLLTKYHIILMAALSASFLAGHWQTFFFVAINTFFYLIYRIPLEFTKRRIRQWIQLTTAGLLFLLIISVQLLPSLEFIQKTARNIDPTQWQRLDWFYPYPHFIQLVAPDFFGNPASYNYWGVWNYGEYSSYVGLIPLIAALALIIKYCAQKISNIVNKNKPYLNSLDISESNIGIGFFLFCLLINLLLITRNPLTELPYQYNLPFIATTQPSRGIVMICFSLCILAAVSLSHWLKNKQSIQKHMLLSWAIIASTLTILWLITYSGNMRLFDQINTQPTTDVTSIARRNLILPTFIVAIFLLIIVSKYKSYKTLLIIPSLLLILVSADVARNFHKFNTWSDAAYLYPATPLTSTNTQYLRYITTDSRLIAPNINIPYRIQTVEGYDPLYFKHYGEFIGIWVRNAPDLSAFPANRILTPHTYNQKLAAVAGVTHLLTFDTYDNLCAVDNTTCLNTYGLTKRYQLPTPQNQFTLKQSLRTFSSPQSLATYMLSSEFNPDSQSLIYGSIDNQEISLGSGQNLVSPVSQTDNKFELDLTINSEKSLLYIPITYDSGWQATLNGKPIAIQQTNYSFQSMQVPQGKHRIVLSYLPQSFMIGLWISVSGILLTVVLTVLNLRTANKYE